MIKFITEEIKQQVTFGMVEEDQFFVDTHGRLMQKTCNYGANRIANNDGAPSGDDGYNFEDGQLIKKILPRVTKIEF